jgi:ribosomal protein S18 acetylase RimI-like enzyme
MSLLSPPPRVQVNDLTDNDRETLLSFLGQDRKTTLYLRSLVHEYGVSSTPYMEHGRFMGGFRNGTLVSVVFLGNSQNFSTFGRLNYVEPVLEKALVHDGLPRLFVGPADHAQSVRRILSQTNADPYLDRSQIYYLLTPGALVVENPIRIRPALDDEVEAIARAQASMTEEDLLIPRHRIDMKRLREISARRVKAGKVWVISEGTEMVFKTEESARSDDGILVGGVYTHPDHRGKSLATRGMASWARKLFEEGFDLIALHVNSDNVGAIKAYERVGFRKHSDLRLILTY